MRRTCERPGCAEPASVAFGMVPEDLLVWLEACDPATLGDDRPGLLCRRHADAMVVPVGWTLDDHREPVPRLFKVRETPAPPKRPGDHTGRMRRPKIHQASLLDLVAEQTTAEQIIDAVARPEPPAPADTPPLPPAEAEPHPDPGREQPVTGAADDQVVAGADRDAGGTAPAWSPTFDQTDDLDGLLAPRGKLLRRAFGAEPPR